MILKQVFELRHALVLRLEKRVVASREDAVRIGGHSSVLASGYFVVHVVVALGNHEVEVSALQAEKTFVVEAR